MGDYTLEVHGTHSYDRTGAISEPIYLSATFRHPAFGQSTGYDYGRVANPPRDALEGTIARLEGGEKAWAVSSGMAGSPGCAVAPSLAHAFFVWFFAKSVSPRGAGAPILVQSVCTGSCLRTECGGS